MEKPQPRWMRRRQREAALFDMAFPELSEAIDEENAIRGAEQKNWYGETRQETRDSVLRILGVTGNVSWIDFK